MASSGGRLVDWEAPQASRLDFTVLLTTNKNDFLDEGV